MDPFGLVVMIIASNFAARLGPSIHPSVHPSDMALVNGARWPAEHSTADESRDSVRRRRLRNG